MPLINLGAPGIRIAVRFISESFVVYSPERQGGLVEGIWRHTEMGSNPGSATS